MWPPLSVGFLLSSITLAMLAIVVHRCPCRNRLRSIPAATERLVELHGGQSLVDLAGVEIELRGQKLALRIEHLEIADDPRAKAQVRKPQVLGTYRDAVAVALRLRAVAVVRG